MESELFDWCVSCVIIRGMCCGPSACPPSGVSLVSGRAFCGGNIGVCCVLSACPASGVSPLQGRAFGCFCNHR